MLIASVGEAYGHPPLKDGPLSVDSGQVVTGEPDYSFYDHYPFIILINEGDDVSLVELSDEDFLDKAGKIVYRVNKYDVFTNDSLLQLLEDVVLPRINSDSLRPRRLVVRGAASPEGPVANNRMLGHRRVETLANFLRARLSVPVDEDSFTSEAVTEDYRLLLVMMRRANDPAYDEVKRLCDIHLPRYEFTILKRKMQRLQGGRLWVRLLKTYFPDLRAARVVLFLEKPASPEKPEKPETPEIPEIPEIPETPETPEELILPRREFLSVKTNLLLDVAYMPGYDRWCPIPNIAVEYYPLKGHFTYGGSFDCPWWQHYNDQKFFQARNYQLETRYYVKATNEAYEPYESYETNETNGTNGTNSRKPAFSGLYFSGYANAALYGICFGERRGWVGEGIGAGLGIGYVMPISRNGHWRLEFSAQAGIFVTKYDPYQYENPINPEYRDHLYYYKWTGEADAFKKRQYRFTWLGPTRIGITLSYDLLYRRIHKKGVSFKSKETLPQPLPVSEGGIYTNPQK